MAFYFTPHFQHMAFCFTPHTHASNMFVLYNPYLALQHHYTPQQHKPTYANPCFALQQDTTSPCPKSVNYFPINTMAS
ncbi:hypothetical protein PIB30_112424 [Stylosanthes scabra]|uniref:Uncharacterized protein n=1 Tax=Stylosanthes scabra TaxID=79078 RepID=A0ABU6Y1S7_9FABA|nr:hypothetical protein [Stylosanthes scabra]